MTFHVTRDVVSDLWPLYQAGEASADSQALVKTFLAQDSAFAATLAEGASLRRLVPPVRLSPDAELRLLQDAQKRARLKLLIIGGSVAVTALVLLTALAGVLFLTARLAW